jgi:glycosyltransferase involved in cell wall biosynthesis
LLVANYESDVGYAWWLMENFWQVVATSLAGSGRECLLAYPRIRVIPDVVRNAPIKTVEFQFGRASTSEVWRGLGFIRRHSIRSVYVSDWPNTHWAYALWRLAGVKQIVLHMHSGGDSPPPTGIRARLKDLLHAIQLFSATLYVAPSAPMAARLQSVARVPRRRCRIVTNGIRLFQPDPGMRPVVRRRIGIPDDAVLIALVSRATYAKGLDFSVQCVADLLKDAALRDRVFAVHCGDGPDLETFRQMAAGADIGDNFRFLGHRNDVREILGAADIALHASRSEAMSLAILEFMCAGLAVVTPDLASVSTAIEPGVTGVTYRHESRDDAVRTLRRLIDDAQLRRSLGSAAARACREKYSLEAMNRAFVDAVVPEL